MTDMSMGNRRNVVLVLILLLTLMLSACGTSGEAPNGTAGETSNNENTEPDKEAKPAEESGFHPTGYPIVDEKITLRFAAAKGSVSKDFDGLPFFEMVEKETNVHIEWSMNPDSSWNEKKNLLFASGELPDAFYGHHILSTDEVLRYGTQGMFVPLEQLIEQYAPNLTAIFEKNPQFKKEITAPDGHIYALPTIDEEYPDSRDALFINKKWLDQLKLPIPETTEQFYETLKAFKENDMNGNGKPDEIPFTFHHHQNYGIYSFFGSFGLTDTPDHIVMRGDKAVFSAVQPEYKEALQYFHRLFKEGLIDVESLTHDKNVYFSKIKSKDNIVGAFSGWDTLDVFGSDPHDFVLLHPLKGPEGHRLWNRYPSGVLSKGAFAITSANKYPEITMRWIDYSYDPMIGLQAVEGPVGINLKVNPDGTIENTPAPEGMTSNEFRHSTAPASKSVFIRTKEIQAKRIRVEGGPGALTKKDIDELYQPYLVENIYPSLFFTEEENEERMKYFTDIDAYVKKKHASWIMQGNVENEWDEYVNTMNRMGLENMMKIYQAAYDRFKAGE